MVRVHFNPLVIKTPSNNEARRNTLWNDFIGRVLNSGLNNYDWQGDPHLNLWSRFSGQDSPIDANFTGIS
jgi:hypothetical protein